MRYVARNEAGAIVADYEQPQLGAVAWQADAGNAGDGMIAELQATAAAEPGRYQLDYQAETGVFHITNETGKSTFVGDARPGQMFDGPIRLVVASGAAPFAAGDGFSIVVGPHLTVEAIDDDDPGLLASKGLDLEGRRQAAHRRINAARTRRRYPGTVALTLPVAGAVPVDLRHEEDERNVLALTSVSLARKALGDDTTIAFKGADNQVYELTPDDLIAMGLMVAGMVKTVAVDWSWGIKARLDAAADVAAIEAILSAEGVA